jgi:hypothetical protein
MIMRFKCSSPTGSYSTIFIKYSHNDCKSNNGAGNDEGDTDGFHYVGHESSGIVWENGSRDVRSDSRMIVSRLTL